MYPGECRGRWWSLRASALAGGQDAGPRAAAGADSKQLPSLLESVLIGGSMRDPPRTLPRTADGVNRSQALGEVSYQLPLYAHAPPDPHGLQELGGSHSTPSFRLPPWRSHCPLPQTPGALHPLLLGTPDPGSEAHR